MIVYENGSFRYLWTLEQALEGFGATVSVMWDPVQLWMVPSGTPSSSAIARRVIPEAPSSTARARASSACRTIGSPDGIAQSGRCYGG